MPSSRSTFPLLLVAVVAGSALGNSGVGYFKKSVAGIPAHVVQIDLSRKDVRLAVVTPSNGIGALESWASLVDRARPVAAITGTYFDTRSGVPVGTLGFLGTAMHKGFIGTAFSYSDMGGPLIQAARPNTTFDFSMAETFLRAGPRLLTDGKTTLYPEAEGFRDPRVFRPAARTGIGITKAGKLQLVAVAKPLLLRQMAAVMKGLGAVDAMCLDGGSSTALYYRGKSYAAPSRQLTNVLVVYETDERYHDRVAMLNPTIRFNTK